MYSLIKSVFKGIPAKQFFSYLKLNAELLQAYDLIEVPCAGTFSIPLFLVTQCGIPPEKILATDISDYSQTLYRMIDKDDTAALRDYILGTMKIKWGENNVAGYDRIVDDTVAGWKKNCAPLKGFSYQTKDLMSYVDEVRAGRLLILNPPNVKNGYVKMFPTDSFGGVAHFLPADVGRLFQIKNHAIIHTSQIPGELSEFKPKGYIVKGNHLIQIFANIETKTAIYQTASETDIQYALATREDVYDPKTIEAVALRADEALCLRDLFIHKLGQTKAERYIAITINKKIFAVVGFHMSKFRMQKNDYIEEQFGMTVQIENEKTAKLMLMMLLSREILSFMPNKVFLYRHPIGIMTSCLSPYPEVKTDRGVLEMYKREKLKDGTYKLGYRSEFKYQTMREAWKEWVKKYGNRLQTVGQAGDSQG